MPTYTPLQSIVLTSPTSSVTFASIPQGYTDLVIVSNIKITTAGFGLVTQFNSDTAGRYSITNLYGNGTTAGSARASSVSFITLTYNVGIPTAVGTFGTAITNIMNYSNSTTFKTVLNRYSNGSTSNDPGTEATVGLWRDTPAIHTITLQQNTGSNNLDTGSTFDLYGISPAAADTAQAFGGTEIIYTNSHVIHVFKASGKFTPYRNLTADYLVVAGGGGGASQHSGGGGGGGYRTSIGGSALSLTSGTSYTVTVGAGGPGSQFGTNPITTNGINGSNSVFSTITSSGGGGGGRYQNVNGNSGGSGGGGGPDGATGGAGNAGGYSPVEGRAGGNGANHATGGGGGGGGGGAGAVGTNAVAGGSGGAGNGGNGVQNDIDGNNYYWAGGGGGGTIQTGATGAGEGGLGGGGGGGAAQGGTLGTGGGSAITSGINGKSSAGNTGADGGSGGTNSGGGGGGGGSYESPAGAGGSGIVIVRYAR
jgi:hypothetical protein